MISIIEPYWIIFINKTGTVTSTQVHDIQLYNYMWYNVIYIYIKYKKYV